MSASLVGSEMCIRDRSPPRAVSATKPGWPACPRSLVPVNWGLGALCGPVSYTHLTLPTICSV
eukprot:1550345-Alexandrium_andersonii.AAC.1